MRPVLQSLAVTVILFVSVCAQVTISSSPTVRINDTVQFTATVSGSGNVGVRWQVSGVNGGNSTVGTISPLGLYIAPSIVPSPAKVTVKAISVADTTKTASSVITIVSCGPVPKGLVSWWAAERNAQDVFGPNRGTAQGGVSYVAGEVALGWNLDGTTGFINVPNTSSLSAIKRTISVEMWALPRSLPPNTWGYMFSRRDPLLSENFSVYVLSDGTLGVLLRTTSSPTTTGSKFESSSGTVTFGKLQHIAATANTNTATVAAYINGVEVPLFNTFGPSTFSGTLSPVKNLYLGRREDVSIEGVGGAGYFPGILDEVSLYSVELTQAQVQSIFNNGVNGKCR